MEDCIFCKIIKGEIPSQKVYEDEETCAFLDIRPTNVGHTLVVPKKHTGDIFTIPEETLCSVIRTAKKICKAVKIGVNADGINIIMNNEAAAGQLVFHSHLHIIPRFLTDGLKHWGHKDYEPGQEEETAQKIISNL
ncbi:MAG: HIT family protein [Candidatus Paceibacterota bacterium]